METFNVSYLNNALALLAFGMLILVTGGVAYLTMADWRDRRRLENEQRQNRRR